MIKRVYHTGAHFTTFPSKFHRIPIAESDHGCIVQILFKQFPLDHDPISVLLNLYHQVSTSQDRIPKIEKKDFQRLALEAYAEGCLDENAMNDQFKKAMEKLLSKPKAS